MEKAGFVYIMASRRNGTIYIGVTSDLPKRIWTSDLPKRIWEHRNDIVEGFTKKYRCHALVWFEAHDSIESARQRELQMKEWKRAWKLREIEGLNPDWEDLYDRIALP
ncbi:MAG TPA: GIY-YIG nuclease family protein [Sphingomonas sp.]|nr:GIY-YIG nuclease family protein [Sphingomonas sp.]